MPKKAARKIDDDAGPAAKKQKLEDKSDVLVKFLVDAASAHPRTTINQLLKYTTDDLKEKLGWSADDSTELLSVLATINSQVKEQDKKDDKADDNTKEDEKDEQKEEPKQERRKGKRVAKHGCVLVSDCIKIHKAIHDKSATSVTLSTGETIPIGMSTTNCRKAVVGGVSFMEQNIKKPSTYAQMAKKGHKITWVLTNPKWGMLCDGRVEINCALFDHDNPDDYTEAEEAEATTTTTTSVLATLTPKKEDPVSDTHLLSLSIEFPPHWAAGHKAAQKIEVAGTTDEFKKIAAMFQKTAAQNVVVTKITRLQHPTLWMRYFLKKQHVAETNENKPEKISHVLTDQLDPKTNEYYFFHGCNPAVVDKIIDGGFDERLGSLSGLFGSGIYFAENSAKSISYTHTATCKQIGANYGKSVCTCKGSKEPRNMFISRAVLGTPWIRLVSTDSSNPMRRPPERPSGVLYDSVMGECSKHDKQAQLPVREYIVYDRHQTYPEYLLEFTLK